MKEDPNWPPLTKAPLRLNESDSSQIKSYLERSRVYVRAQTIAYGRARSGTIRYALDTASTNLFGEAILRTQNARINQLNDAQRMMVTDYAFESNCRCMLGSVYGELDEGYWKLSPTEQRHISKRLRHLSCNKTGEGFNVLANTSRFQRRHVCVTLVLVDDCPWVPAGGLKDIHDKARHTSVTVWKRVNIAEEPVTEHSLGEWVGFLVPGDEKKRA